MFNPRLYREYSQNITNQNVIKTRCNEDVTEEAPKKALIFKRVSMGLTDRRKTAKNLVDSRKNWKILTVSRK